MAERPERPIIVTNHAVDAYRRRRNDQRTTKAIRIEIQECVKAALESGRVLAERPPGFTLYGRKKKTTLPPGQRFVQCDEDSDFGFILKRTVDDGDIVVTTITRAGVQR